MSKTTSATPVYAVLTGDLVRSSDFSPDRLAQVRSEIEKATRAIAAWEPSLLVGGPDFFRGDAWQLVIGDPGRFLRAAVFIRAWLLALEEPADTRIAAGLGSAERIDKAVSQSVGAAFTLSGHKLDSMGRRREIDVSLPPYADAEAAWLPPMLQLCSTIIGRWKPRQALLACAALEPVNRTQVDIAKSLKVTQQGVSDAYVSSGLGSVLGAIEFVEAQPWADLVGKAG